jgi:hypothetical protein
MEKIMGHYDEYYDKMREESEKASKLRISRDTEKFQKLIDENGIARALAIIVERMRLP